MIVEFIFSAICAEDYYQTSADGDPLVCTACPPGSSTDGNTNSNACGKYEKFMIPITDQYSTIQSILTLNFVQLLFVYCFICVVCASTTTHIWDTTAGACVCVVNYYETTAANAQSPAVCTVCPPGSSTDGNINSNACGKYDKIMITLLTSYYSIFNAFYY